MKTFLTALLILGSLVMTGCPAKTIERAEKASAKVATYANVGVDITRTLYRDQIIDLAQKDKIADAFIVLAQGGIAFDQAVANAKAAYPEGSPPPAAIDALFATFNAEVITKMLGVLQSLKVIADVGAYGAIIESLKVAVIARREGVRKENTGGGSVSDMNEYLKYIEIINKLLTIVGNVSLTEAKSWAEVQANAEALKAEGHENEPSEPVEGQPI